MNRTGLKYTMINSAATHVIGRGVIFHGCRLITGTGNITVQDGAQIIAPLVAVASLVDVERLAGRGIQCVGTLNVVASGTAEVLVIWE